MSIYYRRSLWLVIRLILHIDHWNFEEAHHVYPLNDRYHLISLNWNLLTFSLTQPRSTTAICFASRIVESLCAIVKHDRPVRAASNAT
jgi:hypothetical protein